MILNLRDTHLKFNSLPLKSYLPKRKGSSSNHPFFRAELLNFGGAFIGGQLFLCFLLGFFKI